MLQKSIYPLATLLFYDVYRDLYCICNTSRLLKRIDDGLHLFRAPFLLMPSPQRVLRRRDLESDSRVQLILLPGRRLFYPLQGLQSVTLSPKGLYIVWSHKASRFDLG